jgi:hypothetical protein
MTNNGTPQCTQQLVRYIQQQPPAACHLTSQNVDPSMLALTGTTNQLKLDLKNSTNENLTITQINFDFSPSKHNITWNSVAFPSSGTVTGPGSTSPWTMSLSPKPSALTTNDVTIPANGTRSLLLNFASKGQAVVAVGDIDKVCVSFTQPSQGTTVLKCRIVPDPASGNPSTCN